MAFDGARPMKHAQDLDFSRQWHLYTRWYACPKFKRLLRLKIFALSGELSHIQLGARVEGSGN